MNANASLPMLSTWLRSLPRHGIVDTFFRPLRRPLRRADMTDNARLIHSAHASVAAPTGQGAALAPAALSLSLGEVLTLAPQQRMRVVSGRLWLTHAGDCRDFFPGPGSVISGGERSVIEALSPVVLQPA